jgi:hypothetical protein
MPPPSPVVKREREGVAKPGEGEGGCLLQHYQHQDHARATIQGLQRLADCPPEAQLHALTAHGMARGGRGHQQVTRLDGAVLGADLHGHDAHHSQGDFAGQVGVIPGPTDKAWLGGIHTHYTGLLSLCTAGQFPIQTNDQYFPRLQTLDRGQHLSVIGCWRAIGTVRSHVSAVIHAEA